MIFFPTHKLSVVIETLRLSIANFVFQIFVVCKFGKMNVEAIVVKMLTTNVV